MLGHLLPCGGGRSIPLSKSRLVLGARRPASAGAETAAQVTPHAELRFADGEWSIVRMPDAPPVRIKGIECDAGNLVPNDELSIGTQRYRIVYTAPGASASPSAPAPAPPKTPSAGSPGSRDV